MVRSPYPGYLSLPKQWLCPSGPHVNRTYGRAPLIMNASTFFRFTLSIIVIESRVASMKL